MKRIILAILALILTLGCVGPAIGEEESAEKHVTDYDICETVYGLLSCGEEALADGMPAKQVLQEMYAAADAGDFLEQFEAMCENIAAYENSTYRKLVKVLGEEESDRTLDIALTPASEDRDGNWSAYDRYDASDEMREALKDSKAQYCFRPAYWPEEDFSTYLGSAFAKFRPTRSRPGYACVVIQKGAQCDPEKPWNSDDNYDFMNALNNYVNTLAILMDEDAPVFTGNPHLASTFWVFNVSYSFYGWYGSNGQKEIKGYNLNVSLTVKDASNMKELAQFKGSERLGNTIYSWHDGIAAPDIPEPYEVKGFESTVSKLRALVKKERSHAAANRKITFMNAEKVLGGILVEQGNKAEDPWQKAVWQSGPEKVTLNGDRLSFTLRSFDPGVKALGAYAQAEDQAAWLTQALTNASKHDLAVTLDLQDGQPTAKSMAALKKIINGAAKKAKEGFASSDMTAALLNRLFPAPVSGKITKGEQLMTPDDGFIAWMHSSSDPRLYNQEPSALAALAASQKKRSLQSKRGPHDMVLTVTAPDPAALLDDAVRKVLDEVAYLPSEDRDTDDVENRLLLAFADGAVASLKDKNTKNAYTIPLDVDRLLDGSFSAEYWDYVGSIHLTDAKWDLNHQISNLPDEAAQAMPKNGLISGGKSGTQVTVRLTKTSDPTYVQIRADGTDALTATLFVLPGKSVNLKLPKGNYRLYYCSGSYWYGEDTLFGDQGTYSKSEPTQIKDKNYKHTLTIGQSGDVSTYGSDPSEFKKP